MSDRWSTDIPVLSKPAPPGERRSVYAAACCDAVLPYPETEGTCRCGKLTITPTGPGEFRYSGPPECMPISVWETS